MEYKYQTKQLIFWDAKKKQGKLQGGAILKSAQVNKKLQEVLENLTDRQSVTIKYAAFKDNKNKVERVIDFEVKELQVVSGDKKINIEDLKFNCPDHSTIMGQADELKSALQVIVGLLDGFGKLSSLNKDCEEYIRGFECDFRHLIAFGGLTPEDEATCLEEYKKCLQVRAELKKAFLHIMNFKNGVDNNMMDTLQVKKFISYLESPNIGGGYSMRTADVVIQDGDDSDIHGVEG